MLLPIIYTADLELIFASAIASFAVFWSIKKAILLFTSH